MKRNPQNPKAQINGKYNPAYRKWYYEKKEAPLLSFRADSMEAKEFFSENLRNVRRMPATEEKRLAAVKSSIKIKNAARLTQKIYAGLGMRMHPEKFSKDAGDKHVSAKVWSVRNPYGKTFRFMNLNHFIRSNYELFEDGDADWIKIGNRFECRARGGLKALRPSPHKKSLPLSWKGWVWVTLDERALNNAVDPVDRVA